MNRYIQAIGNLTVGITKVVLTKIFHLKSFKASVFSFMSPSSELTLNYGGKLKLGKKIKLRDNSKLRVRKNAVCEIGKNTSINSGNIIVCREKYQLFGLFFQNALSGQFESALSARQSGGDLMAFPGADPVDHCRFDHPCGASGK